MKLLKVNFSIKSFSKEDTIFFKGIAIILIIVHNYFHLIPRFRIQNEISFSRNNTTNFINLLFSNDLFNVFGSVFGYLGHYGVQVFIFFSAYGLSIQYRKWGKTNYKFISNRLKKVYFLLGFGVLFWFFSMPLTGATDNLNGILVQLLYLGSTIGSFKREMVYAMFSGPFWFFALIIQFYIIFPQLYKNTIRLLKIASWLPLAIAYSLIYLLYYLTDPNTFTLFGNIIGHLPEVILGISLAYYKIRSFNLFTILLAILLFTGSQLFEFLFPLSFLAATILLVQFISMIIPLSKGFFKNTILFIGEISMMLFILNGTLRYYPPFMNNGHIRPRMFLVFLLTLFIFSYIYYLLYNFIIRKLRI